MADLLSDGNVRVTFATSISNIAAPTVAELNAGTALEAIITPDGLDISSDTAAVDTSALNSTFTTQAAGRRSYDIKLTFKRLTPTDTALNLLPYRTSGYLVVRRTVASTTAWTIGQKAEVYPVQTGEASFLKPAANELAKFESTMFLTADANTSATVA